VEQSSGRAIADLLVGKHVDLFFEYLECQIGIRPA
jgi:hypothetical protein